MSRPLVPEQSAERGEFPADQAPRSGALPTVAAQGGSWSHVRPEVWTDAERDALRTAFRAALDRGMHGLCFSRYLEGQQPGSQVS